MCTSLVFKHLKLTPIIFFFYLIARANKLNEPKSALFSIRLIGNSSKAAKGGDDLGAFDLDALVDQRHFWSYS